MEEYSFDVQFRPGAKHANADALSRRPCPKQSCYWHDFEKEQALENRNTQVDVGGQLSHVFDIGLSREGVATQQKQDPELRLLYEALEQKKDDQHGKKSHYSLERRKYCGANGPG